MVSYKLGIQSKNEGRILDIDKIVELKNLENLDKFTSAFNNESELKMYLFNQGLISNTEMNKKITVMYRMNGKVKKLPIMYSDMVKNLDYIYLRYDIKILAGNYVEFLEKLARHYSIGSDKFNPQGLNVQDIRLYLSEVRNNAGLLFKCEYLDKAIEDLWQKAVFKAPNKKTGEVNINYRGLRDLALFVYKFKTSLEKEEVKEDTWEQSNLFEEMIDNQETIFPPSHENREYDNVRRITNNDGDPFFPPNSEEEAMYKRYLDELEEKVLEEQGRYRR